jgi:glyoxylase-like metal-dependent hydrolase (beta-lactamase superfamily II)
MTPESLLQYPQANPPGPAEAREIAPGIHWLRMPLPFALDHINLWLLEDERNGEPGWTIIDCGLGNDATRALWEQILAAHTRGRPVHRIIVTHHHPDHVGQAAWLLGRVSADSGAPGGVEYWMAQAEFLAAHAMREGLAGYAFDQVMAMFHRNGLSGERFEKLKDRGMAYRRGVPALPISYRRLLQEQTHRIGGREWRVIMGYGHAPEHAALYCEELEVLISGDMVLPKISTNVSVWATEPEGNPLALFLASIEHYAELPATALILPSHGLPFRGVRERVAQLHEHHRLRLAELHEACDTPKAASEVLSTLFRRELDVQQSFFAMGEAMAHLHYLHAEGRLSRSTGADGVIRYFRN